jgi:mannitol/fructose-specific phosphotransferase system IIA component (Ntr-type)
MVGPEAAVGNHLRLLSRVSRLMNDTTFRESVLQCTSPSDILHLLKNKEETEIE